jgi:hypothetical protein
MTPPLKEKDYGKRGKASIPDDYFQECAFPSKKYP